MTAGLVAPQFVTQGAINAMRTERIDSRNLLAVRIVCFVMQASSISAVLAVAGVFAVSYAFAHQEHVKPMRAPGPSYAAVAPIFKQNCVGCHSGPHPKNGLDLTSYASIMKGDHDGKVIVPGNPARSRLSEAIHHSLKKPLDSMPPGRTLKKAEIFRIDNWISSGAKEK
ncbi:MAG TPA: c-type cytochrome domain-containing protein [Fimbriimonadaceae bacterium]|nr:c-type cytochrome domain-containing protein [Fimbriimonadaceae bacterium]